MRADEGRAILLVFRQEIGVPGQGRDARLLGRFESGRHGRRIGRRHRDPVDALGDEVLHDLHLLGFGVLGGTDVDALDVLHLFLRLHAAVARQVEEWIVHRLGDKGELVFVGRKALAGKGHHRGNCCGGQQPAFHVIPPIKDSPLGRA